MARFAAFMNTPRAQETLYFQNPAGKLFYHPTGFVHLAWNTERLALEAIQSFYEQALALLINTRSRYILSDHGRRAPLSAGAQQWLTENWIPRAIGQARVSHCAIVEGADPLHRLSTQSVLSAAPAGIWFQRFATFEAAQTWLLSKPR